MCYGIAWSYHLLIYGSVAAGFIFDIPWLRHVGLTLTGILYLPWCNENFLTIPLAILLHTKVFGKRDPKTRAQLDEMMENARNDWAYWKAKFRKLFRRGVEDESKPKRERKRKPNKRN